MTAAGGILSASAFAWAGGGGPVLGEGHNAQAQGQLHGGVQVLIDVQTHHAGALFEGGHAVPGADQDGLGPKGQHQRPGQKDGAHRAVHLGHLVGQKHKAHQNIDRVPRLDRLAQRLRRVHGDGLPGIGPAARVKDAADTVSPGVQAHEGIQIFADVAFFQFVPGHNAPPFSPTGWCSRCSHRIPSAPRSEWP